MTSPTRPLVDADDLQGWRGRGRRPPDQAKQCGWTGRKPQAGRKAGPQVSLSSAWLVAALGLLGTTISPYMLFWQAAEDAEELHQSTTIQADQENSTVWWGMMYSNLISFFIIVAAATTIHSGGDRIQTLADAAQALSPLGAIGEAVFIVGVIGSGLLALPVLAGSTAYAVAEIFDWPEGLGSKAAQARGFC